MFPLKCYLTSNIWTRVLKMQNQINAKKFSCQISLLLYSFQLLVKWLFLIYILKVSAWFEAFDGAVFSYLKASSIKSCLGQITGAVCWSDTSRVCGALVEEAAAVKSRYYPSAQQQQTHHYAIRPNWKHAISFTHECTASKIRVHVENSLFREMSLGTNFISTYF